MAKVCAAVARDGSWFFLTLQHTHTHTLRHALRHTLTWLMLIPAVHLLPPRLLGLPCRSVEGLHPLLSVLLLVRPKLVARVVFHKGKLQLRVPCKQERAGSTHTTQTEELQIVGRRMYSLWVYHGHVYSAYAMVL